MVLWTGNGPVRQDVRDIVGGGHSYDLRPTLARLHVERVKPAGREHVPFARIIGILGILAFTLIFGGGLLWWADILARLIAAR